MKMREKENEGKNRVIMNEREERGDEIIIKEE